MATNGHNRFKELSRRGVPKFHAAVAAGVCQDTWRSSRPWVTTISTHSAFPDSMTPPGHKSAEPQWYGPVCPLVREGWCCEAFPYPDQSPARSDQFATKRIHKLLKPANTNLPNTKTKMNHRLGDSSWATNYVLCISRANERRGALGASVSLRNASLALFGHVPDDEMIMGHLRSNMTRLEIEGDMIASTPEARKI